MLLDRLVRITGLVLERAWAAADLLHAATTDALTGLANRATFFRQLSEAVSDPEQGPLVGVLYLDIDDFKPVNDRLGHAAGDAVLQEIGRRLTRSMGVRCTAARLGGDEFRGPLSWGHRPSVPRGAGRADHRRTRATDQPR